ncbi:dipeptide/tripeptide permease [Balneicella halophila]|uniref:Dipeptide/tripeptide permease n=1 Tax=Balneicella halophila TaxID=1537566 RepID=A0A7L4UPK0_BALHA|nr:MFS transporter [Balneicella halophila]PVX51038.1 dipeptide/tripeptide permease [Balneicella halophila]
MGVAKVFKKFPKTFWVANIIELFERWAWYGFFMLFANYLTGSVDTGALGLTQTEKGYIMGFGTAFLYFLPVLTGSIADKYGYKKVLFVAFVIYTTAFIFLPMVSSFWGVFGIFIYLAIGAALFKPVISATVAKTTTDETSSIGFGIFYMMVNIGAFIGPMVTLLFKNSSYDLVFYISAGIIALNFILLLFYKEPDRVVTKESLGESLKTVFVNIGKVLADFKFVVFLAIVAGFWTMYNQLFFTLPVFIAQWVDTSAVYDFFSVNIPFFSENYGKADGQMEAEFITNFDAMFIIIFQIVVSSIVMRIKPLKTMTVGFLVCSIGMALTLATQNVMYTIGAILIFSLGEMAGSPKITEYIGRIAPLDKKALYMGYSFIPVFVGNALAGLISGGVYQNLSDKTEFVQQEVAKRGLDISDSLSQNDYFETAATQMGMSSRELTNYLWDAYHPYDMWYVILGIGLVSVIALYLYDRFMMREKK